MGFKRDYVKEINDILMSKRDANDVRITLNIPEHKFKKNSDKFNFALSLIYNKYNNEEEEIKLFHILLSLQEYFDMDWLVGNILSEDNKKLITDEIKSEYNHKLRQGNPEVRYYTNEELKTRDLYDDSDLEEPKDLTGDEKEDG